MDETFIGNRVSSDDNRFFGEKRRVDFDHLSGKIALFTTKSWFFFF